MLTLEGCLTRRRRLWDRLPSDLQSVLIHDPAHLLYFANYWQSPFVFRSNDAGAVLLLGRDGSSVLIADNFLEPFVARSYADEKLMPVWYRCIESAPRRQTCLLMNAVPELRRRLVGDVGLEMDRVPAAILAELWASRTNVRIVDIASEIMAMRRQKDADELALLSASTRAGEAGMAAARRDIKPGITEIEVFLLVQRAVCEAAGEPVQVYGDFVSGPRCEQIGGPPSDRKIQAGDLVLLDFSAVIHGYRADFANTFACGAWATPKQRDMFLACIDAMDAGEQNLRPGVSGRTVYEAVCQSFAANHYAESFPHHAGHGIGLGHPEAPFLVPASADVLLPGDVLTLEPGLYVPGVGGMRFERNYLITEHGPTVLTRHELSLDTAQP